MRPQGFDMRSIVDVLVRQIKGEDLTAVGVDPNVQFTPGPRFAVPCFSNNDSPAPRNFKPVLSTIKCISPDAARALVCTGNPPARLLSVVWSGTGKSTSSMRMIEPIRPSVWRSAMGNTARKASAVSMARSE